ncbi:MAG: Gfo/Idh/MocA family oxidoreductase [Deltaproteobacteria bacterium]|nr:Gfo/Idh/MocA family oxidoreductase [Deltaproteobacteria bacterium]
MRIAVLGCGSIGRRHLGNLLSLGHHDLLAFDPAAEARRAVEEQIGIPVFASLDEVWSRNPEAALVTAGTNAHVELALEAARRGCHLFIEKPLSHSLDGVTDLLAEVERRDLVTIVGCNMRFHPGPMTLKRLLEKNSIGQVVAARLQVGSYLPRWQPGHDYRHRYSASAEWGGAILDCIHELDLALWYFGPAEVTGAASLPAATLGLETDGLAEILLRHRCGVLSSVHLNFIQRDYRRACQIIGSEGTLYWDFNEDQVTLFGADGEIAEHFRPPEGWKLSQMYIDEIKHFLRSVQDHCPTTNPISGGLEVLKLALAAKQAASIKS